MISELINTPRLYTALAEWGACLVYILMLRRKQSGPKLVLSLFGALPVFILYQLLAGILPLYLWIPGMFGAICLMFAFIYLLTDTTPYDAGYSCINAFVLAEFAASLHWQIYAWCALTLQRENYYVSVISMLIIYAASYTIYYFLVNEHIPKDVRMNLSGKELSGAVVIALTTFGISNLSFVMPNSPFSTATTSLLYIRTLVDFGGLLMLYTTLEKREELRIKSENQAMNTLFQHQYNQYRLSIDNMELLRREFHDLKHYMIAIRSEKDPVKKEQYLLEMEEAILTQEALSNTGNGVLDVILTSKSTYCTQNNITFTCMADGNLISFMHVKDICSIFGNALDNAIECVSLYDDPEKRLITLNMYQKNQLLMIQVENYTENTFQLTENSLPSTTKNNKEMHGYGMKSIQHAAQKYGGSMTFHAEDNWFTLCVLIPVETSA